MKYLPIVWLLGASLMFIELFNPFGWGQRLFWGRQPPYHWIQGDMSRNTEGSIDEHYIGANGVECAEVYRFASQNSMFTVLGFGFDGEYETQAQAEAKAQRECR